MEVAEGRLVWCDHILGMGNADPSLKDPVELGLIEQLRVSCLVGLQLHCHFL